MSSCSARTCRLRCTVILLEKVRASSPKAPHPTINVSDLDYDLPKDLIAQHPLPERAASRLLAVWRQTGRIEDRRFHDLPDLLSASDFLVLNDTRVFPARLFGILESGGQVEVLLLGPIQISDPVTSGSRHALHLQARRSEVNDTPSLIWEALARPKRRLRPGSRLHFSPDLVGVVREPTSGTGREKVHIEFQVRGSFLDVLERTGHVPLPPYIRRDDATTDRERYQTVYATATGSVAAATAGLHFTREILDQLAGRGVGSCFVTLHVGYGTFRPIAAETVECHRVDSERLEVSPPASAAIRDAVAKRKRLIAVGTTSTRALESWIQASPGLTAFAGETDLCIYPPFQFKLVGGLLTNFHLPRSSLLALVCAFLGVDLARACYDHAIRQGYRFYSYGDCMLIL